MIVVVIVVVAVVVVLVVIVIVVVVVVVVVIPIPIYTRVTDLLRCSDIRCLSLAECVQRMFVQ